MDEIELQIRHVLKQVFSNYHEKLFEQEVDLFVNKINLIFQKQVEQYINIYEEKRNLLSNNYNLCLYNNIFYDFFNDYPFYSYIQSYDAQNPYDLYHLSIYQPPQDFFTSFEINKAKNRYKNKKIPKTQKSQKICIKHLNESNTEEFKKKKKEEENQISIEKHSIDNKNITISSFNSLPIKSQQKIISDIKQHSKTPILASINNLLLFLIRFSNKPDDHFFIISAKNDVIQIKQSTQNLTSFQISDSCTTILIENGIINSNEFCSIISSLPLIAFSIKFPSSTFSDVYDQILRMKRKYPRNIKICILIADSSSLGFRFSGNGEIDELLFGDSVTNIGDQNAITTNNRGPFSNCTSLTKIKFSSSVKKLGYSAFNNCRSLNEVSFQNSLTKIGNHSFAHCTSLTMISIPNSVTSIERSAFNGCTSLSSVSIPPSVRLIEDYVFNDCSSLASVSIPNSVTKIGDHSFAHYTSLTTIFIPDSVTSIEKSAFNGCTSLSSVSIPPSVNELSNFVFNDYSSQRLAITALHTVLH